MKNFKQIVSSCLIVCIALAGLPLSAQAGIVATDEVSAMGAAAANRDKLETFLARADVRQAVQAQGVDAQAAAARVKAMSDVEVAQLAGRIDQAPVGGDVLSMVFTVFLLLLVTDILGLTKVYPFTRSIR
jgi:hypothetical protein